MVVIKVYNMEERYSIIAKNAPIYRKARKKEKTQILNELHKYLPMNRSYIAYLLRNTGKKVYLKGGKVVLVGKYSKELLSKRGRKKFYTKEIEKPLFEIWKSSGFVSSKHLEAYIKINWDKIYKELGHLFDTEEKIYKIRRISAATIDRLLKKYRRVMELKNKRRGNPFSTKLKRSIQVESWFDKKKEVGEVEIDLVHHCGESGYGEFIYTLTVTEITTGWTELIPLRNKAMVWTVKALKEVIKNFPVKIKRIHTDNGSEFINSHLFRFCQESGIEFVRSRPYRKNDAPYVESKNWSLVRQYTGWRRYDTEEEYRILRKLMKLVSIRHNLIVPQMKVVEKHRINGKR